ncbi:MAG: FAD:protein FMN transferase [Actinomycetes bacterium]
MALPEHDLNFKAMGSSIRVLSGPPAPATGGLDPEGAAAGVRAMIERYEADLTRFDPASELSRLNRDPRPIVPASGLMRSLVGAALWAADTTDGLVDPTVVGALEEAGYGRSLADSPSAPLAEALAAAPTRRPARPRSDSPWRLIAVDDEQGTVTRPPGVRIDSGGVGKGLAADVAASMLADRMRFCVSCGGDLRVGGPDALADPYPVLIEDPFGGDPLLTLRVGSGAVATSGLGKRVWQMPDGSFAHHLLDPSTGSPAWTGVLQVTALAETALEAETLSKQVLLGGPRSIHLLERRGGVVVLDDCTVELVGPVSQAVRRGGMRLYEVPA